MFSITGDLVLDPFLGSGTSLIAALDLGRRFVGYELLDELVEVVKMRLGAGLGRVLFEKQAPLSVEIGP